MTSKSLLPNCASELENHLAVLAESAMRSPASFMVCMILIAVMRDYYPG
jgi:hypothetical protein